MSEADVSDVSDVSPDVSGDDLTIERGQGEARPRLPRTARPCTHTPMKTIFAAAIAAVALASSPASAKDWWLWTNATGARSPVCTRVDFDDLEGDPVAEGIKAVWNFTPGAYAVDHQEMFPGVWVVTAYLRTPPNEIHVYATTREGCERFTEQKARDYR
jgi:hypothetical protein